MRDLPRVGEWAVARRGRELVVGHVVERHTTTGTVRLDDPDMGAVRAIHTDRPGENVIATAETESAARRARRDEARRRVRP